MPHQLEQRISHTRRQARRLLTRYGVGWTLVSLVAVVAPLALADYLVRFEDRGIRLICSLAVAGVVAAAVYRFLVAPLAVRFSNVEIARRIERRFPQLDERLSSAIEFLRRADDDAGAGSAALRRAVIHDAETVVNRLDLDEALDRRPARRALLAAGGALAVALTLVVCSPRSAWLALERLAKPFGDERWPRQYNLEFRTAPTRLAAGDSFDAELVDAGGRLPDDVRVFFRFEEETPGAEIVETIHPQGDMVVAHQDRVERPFAYRAEGGDDHLMDWRSVEVIETPRVESFKVAVTPPAYTGWPAETSDGQIQALVGSRLEFTGAATKRLTAVAFRQGERLAPGVVSADGLGFRIPGLEGPLLVNASGPYSFELTDGEGLIGGKSDRWEIHAIPDQRPTVLIEQPAGNLFVTAAAVVPIKVTARDDLALSEITLHAYRSGPAGPRADRAADQAVPPGEPPARPVERSDEGSLAIALFRGPERVAPRASAAAAEVGESRVLDYAWSLGSLGLKPGAQVTFYAAASDYLPQQGQSPPRKLTIISPQELEERVAQRQQVILAELARTLKMQQETRAQTTALEIQARDVGRLAKADIDRAQAAELGQRQVARSLAGEREGIPGQIKELFADLESNRVDSPDLARRMQEMLDQLGDLRDMHLGPIERELTSAIKGARDELSSAASGQDSRPARLSADKSIAPRGASPPDATDPASSAAAPGNPAPNNTVPEVTAPHDAAAPADKASADKASADKAVAGKVPSESPPAEKAPAGKAVSEKAAAGAGQSSPQGPTSEPSPKGSPAASDQQRDAPAPASPVARSLSEAGQHQDRVIESLEAMLGRLSQWDNYRRFAREIAQLRQQQEELAAATQEASAKTLGKELKDLDPQQQADLKKLAARQHELARNLDKLEQQMGDARQRLADDDPLAAEALGDALDEARRKSLSGRMRRAGDEAQRNQVAQAVEGQKKIAQELEELQDILSNRREQELGRLVRKLREAERDLEQLRARQGGLRKKMNDAAKIAEAAERQRELERLTREERQLQDESQRMARRLERLQADRAGKKMSGAASRMSKSGQSGEQGDAAGAESEAEEAERDLEEAQQDLAQRRRQAESDLAQEQMAKIEDTIKSLRERQGRIRAEAARYAELLQTKGRLSRGEASGVQELARQQRGLAAEAAALAEKIAAAEVFQLALNSAAEAMRLVADLVARRDFGPPLTGALSTVERRLDNVIKSLAEGKKKQAPGGKGGQGGEGGDQGAGQGGGDQGGIRSIAELRLLKLMQEDLRDRLQTTAADRVNSPTERAMSLERLAAEQGRLADLTLRLSKPTNDNPEDHPEKLPDIRGEPPENRSEQGESPTDKASSGGAKPLKSAE